MTHKKIKNFIQLSLVSTLSIAASFALLSFADLKISDKTDHQIFGSTALSLEGGVVKNSALQSEQFLTSFLPKPDQAVYQEINVKIRDSRSPFNSVWLRDVVHANALANYVNLPVAAISEQMVEAKHLQKINRLGALDKQQTHSTYGTYSTYSTYSTGVTQSDIKTISDAVVVATPKMLPVVSDTVRDAGAQKRKNMQDMLSYLNQKNSQIMLSNLFLNFAPSEHARVMDMLYFHEVTHVILKPEVDAALREMSNASGYSQSGQITKIENKSSSSSFLKDIHESFEESVSDNAGVLMMAVKNKITRSELVDFLDKMISCRFLTRQIALSVGEKSTHDTEASLYLLRQYVKAQKREDFAFNLTFKDIKDISLNHAQTNFYMLASLQEKTPLIEKITAQRLGVEQRNLDAAMQGMESEIIDTFQTHSLIQGKIKKM